MQSKKRLKVSRRSVMLYPNRDKTLVWKDLKVHITSVWVPMSGYVGILRTRNKFPVFTIWLIVLLLLLSYQTAQSITVNSTFASLSMVIASSSG